MRVWVAGVSSACGLATGGYHYTLFGIVLVPTRGATLWSSRRAILLFFFECSPPNTPWFPPALGKARKHPISSINNKLDLPLGSKIVILGEVWRGGGDQSLEICDE